MKLKYLLIYQSEHILRGDDYRRQGETEIECRVRNGHQGRGQRHVGQSLIFCSEIMKAKYRSDMTDKSCDDIANYHYLTLMSHILILSSILLL